MPDFYNSPVKLDLDLSIEAKNPAKLWEAIQDGSLQNAVLAAFGKVVGQMDQRGAAAEYTAGTLEDATKDAAGNRLVSAALSPANKASERIVSKLTCGF